MNSYWSGGRIYKIRVLIKWTDLEKGAHRENTPTGDCVSGVTLLQRNPEDGQQTAKKLRERQ